MKSYFSKGRLEALSDGVYAIAMTILVLNIDVGKMMENSNGGNLTESLWAMFPVFYSYVLGFFLLAIFWVTHNKQSRNIKRIDGDYIWINMLALMLISLVPFSTSLIGDYGEELAAAVFFHINLLLVGLAYFWLWRYSISHADLLDSDLDKKTKKSILYRNLILPIVALVAIVVSFVSPDWSSLAYLSIPVVKRWI